MSRRLRTWSSRLSQHLSQHKEQSALKRNLTRNNGDTRRTSSRLGQDICTRLDTVSNEPNGDRTTGAAALVSVRRDEPAAPVHELRACINRLPPSGCARAVPGGDWVASESFCSRSLGSSLSFSPFPSCHTPFFGVSFPIIIMDYPLSLSHATSIIHMRSISEITSSSCRR